MTVPVYNMTDTWTASGTTYSAIQMNVTNTASAAASMLLNLQIGGVVTAGFDKFGTLQIGAGDGATAPDIFLSRDAAGIWAQRNSTNAQTFRVYNTYTNSTNYERGIFDWNNTANTLTIGMEKAGTGSWRDVTIQYGTYLSFLNQFGVSAIGMGSRIDFYISGPQLCATIYALLGTGSMSLPAVGQYVFSSTSFSNGAADTALARSAAGIIEVNAAQSGIPSPNLRSLRVSDLYRHVPITKTADWTVNDFEYSYINNKSGSTATVTLPTASSYNGRELLIMNYQAQTVVSASSNVCPSGSGTAGTAILAATAGKWAVLISDGTNWIIMLNN